MIIKILKKSFLFEIFKISKVWFFIIISFLLFQMFFTYKGVETFPFLNYGMYSDRFYASDTLSIVKLKSQNDLLFKKNSTSIIIDSYLNYKYLSKHDDPILRILNSRFRNNSFYPYLKYQLINHRHKIDLYPKWIKRYCLKTGLGKIRIMEDKLIFEDNQFKLFSSKEIFNTYD